MIGSGAVALGCMAAVLLVPLLGGGGPDPGLAHAGRALVMTRADEAHRALERLEAALQPALAAARSGAAAVVAGDDAPGEDLALGAEELRKAAPSQRAAHAAIAALEAARRALDPDAAGLELDLGPGDVSSIAAQLDGTVTAADHFVAMRLRAERLPATLDRAIAALEAGDIDAAEARIDAGRADLDALQAWEVDFATLPVWIDTTDAMVGALERVVAATRAGDRGAASQAAADFAGQRDEAAAADRALRIAIGEGGAAVTATPLGRLAEVLRAVESTRLQVASIVQTVRR